MNKKLIFTIILSSIIFLLSCDSAKEKVEETAKNAGEIANEAAEKGTELADEAAKKAEEASEKLEKFVDQDFLVGTWSGKLDSRSTTLTITSQKGNDFEGKIKINYRNPTNQEIKGAISEDGKTIEMKDQIQYRNKGIYKGTLSEDGKNFSGMFTILVDKKNHSFNLTKIER